MVPSSTRENCPSEVNVNPIMQRFLLLLAVSPSALPAFATDEEVKNIYVAPEGN